MSNAIFPTLPGLAWNVVRSPIWSTRVQTTVSGKETRTADWVTPLWQWELQYELLRDDATDELRTLMGFYLQRQGSYDDFLFQDPDDNSVAGAVVDSSADGSTTAFQLLRSLGGYPEPMTAIDAVSAVYLNGTAQATSGWSVDLSTGILTFATAPASGSAITADFTYYFRVRFKEDEADFEKFAQALWGLKTIHLMSVK
ncbi:MAG TPA: DUF2460 domain-containing protein [Alphaproteobacteria bacterium]|nr:DUF2460 domain-containing protein [Alphaproteobacteria bacterium]